MTGAKDQGYFVDGMVVEIVAALSNFQFLFVIASASRLSCRGDARSPGRSRAEGAKTEPQNGPALAMAVGREP